MFIMTSASSQKSFLSKTVNNTIDQLKDLNQQSRGRSNRASSLALPNTSIIDLLNTDQPILNPITLAPPPPNPNSNTRRHSSHHCPVTEDYKTIANNPHIISRCEPKPQAVQPAVPPPVPKRTFQNKVTSQLSNDSEHKVNVAPSKDTTDCSSIGYNKKCSEYQVDADIKRSFCSDQISDDDRLSIESSVFEEPRTGDLVHIEGHRSNFAKSNRSSSDSNKSHATIDTGYMSASNDHYRTILSGSSEEYRNRISSVDTQSSIDSYVADVHNHKGSISPFAKLSHNSPFDMKPRDMEFDDFQCDMPRRHQTNNKMRNTDEKIPKNLPAVPLRKQGSVPKLPPPVSMGSAQRSRGAPPVPPMRSQTSLDSGKLLQNGQMFAAFQAAGQSITGKMKKQDAAPAQEMHQKPTTKRNAGHKPPPLTQIHQSKINQRQDSTISSDSFSQTSSPGYNSKSMEAPLIQYASRITRSAGFKHQDSCDSFGVKYNYANKSNMRQDSNVSSDSFSQTSSPGYNTKLMEAPLLAHAMKLNNFKQPFKGANDILKETVDNNSNAAITKSASTPASLQTIVRFQNGSNMSLQHKILNRRKSSNPYITRGRLKFRLCQVILNAVALLAIAGGLAAYFNAHPTVKFINKTIITPNGISSDNRSANGKLNLDNMSGISSPQSDKVSNNPAPGVCLPIIVKFCQNAHLPYNYTVFPNYVGHFGQPEVQTELEEYDALVDVQCYELVALFLCSLFVPKCGNAGNTIPPCKLLCTETMRRCGFFFDVFGLNLPDYLNCDLFTDSKSCVGFDEVHIARSKENNPDLCTGFLCDKKRCIPSDWRCDGHVDCVDQTDESKCDACGKGSIYCGENRCMSQKHVCDGVADCPWGQDERNCVRLSDQNGDLGKGVLEVYKADIKKWTQVCISNWEQSTSPSAVCSMLGYNSVNSTRIISRDSNKTLIPGLWPSTVPKRQFNSLKDFKSCKDSKDKAAIVELTCSNFECGKVRSRRYKPQTRIVGGIESTPGDWPFLAAILGGPEEIFYCAGVLIADQWVLTASHCIGNYGSRNTTDFTVQLGITRRHSHTYYGQKIPVSKLIPHPKYNSVVAHDNDIALFQLAKKVAFHEQLLPVCLPPEDTEITPDTLCTVIGWGKSADGSSNSAIKNSYEAAINEVQVPVLNRDLCNEWLDTLNVTEGMICAGYPEGGKDACQGDSGGPLLCRLSGNNRNKWFVGGIVSWGISCASPKLPGVYANVPKYIPWIKAQMKQHTDSTVPTVSN